MENVAQQVKKERVWGDTMKCINCGYEFNAYEETCPYCGYNLDGIKAVESVNDFSKRLNMATDDKSRAEIIKVFPIPNSKTDVFEFMILASSFLKTKAYNSQQNTSCFQDEISQAWIIKIEQCKQKAKLILKTSSDIKKMEALCDETDTLIRKDRNIINKTVKVNFFLKNIGFFLGLIIVLISLAIDLSGNESSICQLVAIIILIVSSCLLKKTNADILEYIIGVATGFVLLFLARFFDNGSMITLTGGIILIAVFINFILYLTKKR